MRNGAVCAKPFPAGSESRSGCKQLGLQAYRKEPQCLGAGEAGGSRDRKGEAVPRKSGWEGLLEE